MRKLLPYIILLINAFSCFAQEDIYDLKHSKQYAKHLLNQKNYKWAVPEWERIVKMEPLDSNRIVLLKTYRLAGNYNEAEILSSSMLSSDSVERSKYDLVMEEYFKALILNEKYSAAQLQYNTYKASSKNASVYYFQATFLNKEWQSAKTFYNSNQNIQNPTYTNLIQRADNLKYKSPALAATMSTLIPGSGKFYTGDWKDGVMALFMVGTSAWQAYEGFSRQGTRSVYGWIYGGLAAGFYTGAIYGSYKSAERYNERQEKQLIEDAKEVFFSAY